MAVYIDPACSVDELRTELYSGNFVVLSRLRAVRRFVEHTRRELATLFAPAEPAECHQMVADEREHLPRRPGDRDRAPRDQLRVEVDADEPERAPERATPPAQRLEHPRIDRWIEPIRVGEAQPQLHVATPPCLAVELE